MLNVVHSIDKNLIEQKAYQQALSDFGFEELLEKITNYSDADFDAEQMNLEPEEVETLTTILIQHWSNSLNGKLLGGFLNAIRHGNSEILSDSMSQEIQLPDSGLPNNFPDVEMPHYSEGKTVRWFSAIENSDWGIILGRFYAYAPHRCCWAWKYVVLLDKNSPSEEWCVADVAWENDLVEVNNGK
ncbi:hypothetical protein H6F96_10075 [Microcoleus sp. FACHB-53]|nr:hypothetical protein [Microcoleus sp. FACHB-53]